MKLQNDWWCVRHGQGKNNLAPLVTGRAGLTGLGLTDLGIQQATASAAQDSQWDVIIASPYLRAHETAQCFADRSGNEICIEPRFSEQVFGDLEGQPKTEFDVFANAHTWRDPFPNGESMEGAGVRALEGIKEWDQKFAGKRILLVAHTQLLRGLMGVIYGELAGHEELPHATPFPLPEVK